MPWGLAIGAGAGLLKNELVDKPEADRQRKLQAQIAAYSPWTGMKASPVANPSALGSMIGLGGTGASIASGIHSADANANLNNAMADSYKSGGGLLGGGAVQMDGSMPFTSSSVGPIGDSADATGSGLFVGDPSTKDPITGNITGQMPQKAAQPWSYTGPDTSKWAVANSTGNPSSDSSLWGKLSKLMSSKDSSGQ